MAIWSDGKKFAGSMIKGAFTLLTVIAIFSLRALPAFSLTLARVGVPSPSASYFPAIVAWKKDFYAQESVQSEFIMMRPSIVPAALSNGEIQYTTATGTVAGATLRGFPFKIVAYFSIRPMDSFVVKPQVKSVADLGG